MRRSIENAEHVGKCATQIPQRKFVTQNWFHMLGLFAPRVGQQYRDEQRRRRSQFDRGTSAAEREIVYVRTYTPRRSHGVNNGLRSAPCTYPAMGMWYDRCPTLENGPRTS